MKGLLSDANINGPFDILIARMQADPWKLFWDDLHLKGLHFADVGLAADAPDSTVWELCQAEELVLLTDNRNHKGEDSLEATIRRCNTASSLPVLTIGRVSKIQWSGPYHLGNNNPHTS